MDNITFRRAKAVLIELCSELKKAAESVEEAEAKEANKAA